MEFGHLEGIRVPQPRSLGDKNDHHGHIKHLQVLTGMILQVVLMLCGNPDPKNTSWAMKKIWLFRLGDEIFLPCDVWIMINHDIRMPINAYCKNNQYFI